MARLFFAYILGSVLLGSLMLTGCSDIVPICTVSQKIPDLTLYYSTPVVFNFTIPGEAEKVQDLYLETEITYYTPIGRAELPLHLVLEDLKNKQEFPMEFEVKIPLKIDNKWQGKQESYETDFTLTSVVLPHVKLKPGNYSMKVFANDNKSEKIYGIVKMTARLFENNGKSTPTT